MPTVQRRPNPRLTSTRGTILLEVLLAGVILSLIGAALFAALLGANRSVKRAGQYTAATALGQSIIQEMRLYPAADPRLAPGTWEWCPPACPERVERALVEVEIPADLPETLRRITVSIFRTGVDEPVQVISHVRQ